LGSLKAVSHRLSAISQTDSPDSRQQPITRARSVFFVTVLMNLGMPLIWGSVWALALTGVLTMLFIWRTAQEDQTLRLELRGYEEYAARTRYRLLPGVW